MIDYLIENFRLINRNFNHNDFFFNISYWIDSQDKFKNYVY